MSSTFQTPLLSSAHRILPILSCPTQILHYPSSSSICLVFIPGNPGLVTFYHPLLSYIHSLTGHEIYGISYASHTTLDTSKTGDVDCGNLIGQIEHKQTFINTISKPLIIISHSIGSYISRHLTSTYGIIRLIEITPFTRFDPDNISDKLPPIILTKIPTLVRLISKAINLGVTYLIPSSILTLVLKLTGCNQTEEIVKLVKSPGYYDRFLCLGYDEISSLPRTLDLEGLNRILKKIPISQLYVPDDLWASLRHAKQIQECKRLGYVIGDIRVKIWEGGRHDFCVREGWEEAGKWCVEEIRGKVKL
ncbi:hypothetical protein TrLO_g1790 [Triparma laevis f. longispina]|uniref:Uncharacterized protein n=1 Tax=Triparma laevis f. longispina TaxID=1714387 RepID=A0A9W7FTT1_9STRA|nr:hypothetical protein TrLO_g1790 [Triparma laevis f. longispina]